MKKTIFAIVVAVSVAACGTKATNDQPVDSAAVVVDTTAVSGNGEVQADTLK